MKHNLKFQLVKFERALAFQIWEQTDEWIVSENSYQESTFYDYKDKIRIITCKYNHCEFDYEKLFLLNAESGSSISPKIAEKIFEDNQERDKYYNLILEALKEWSAYVYEKTNREPQEFQDLENGVFIV